MSIDFNHKQDKSDQKIVFCKDQIKPQADWRAVDSPKQICFVCFFAFHGKENKFHCLFFGRIYGVRKPLSVLSNLCNLIIAMG